MPGGKEFTLISSIVVLIFSITALALLPGRCFKTIAEEGLPFSFYKTS